MKKMIFIAALSLSTLQTANAAGTSGASFLKMGAGARASAMGESFVAVANDATATYWNPAGVARAEETQISAMQNTHLVNTQYQHLAAVKPMGRLGFGLSIARMSYGSIDKYSASNVHEGSYDASSLAAGFSAGAQINENLSVGATAKLIQEAIESESASGFAADFGVLYNMKTITWGASIQNLGPTMKMVKETYNLPLTIRIGGATKILNDKLTLSAGLTHVNDSGTALQTGVEYSLNKLFTLRGGYKLSPGASDLGGLVGVTGGFGIEFDRFTVDYAVTPFGDLGLSHRLSLLVRFAAPSSY